MITISAMDDVLLASLEDDIFGPSG